MEEVNCQFCGSSQRKIILTGCRDYLEKTPGEFTVVRCDRCKLFYLNPRPAAEKLTSRYSCGYYAYQQPNLSKLKKRLAKLKRFPFRATLTELLRYPAVQKYSLFEKIFTRLSYLFCRPVFRGILEFRGNARILDIGCGNGLLTYDLAQKARHVTAIDINKDNIEFARLNYNRENIKYLHGDATRFNFKTRFDTVVMSNLLEHIDNRPSFLAKIRKLANTFLIRVPQFDRDWLTYYKSELGVEYRLDPTHKIEYTMASLSQELKQAGMGIKRASIQFGEIWVVVGRLQ